MYEYVYNTSMFLTWDEAKRQANLRKHGFDFADVESVFEGDTFTFEDDRFDYGEVRLITLGLLQGMVVVVIHAEEESLIRIISMRKADKHEQKLYFQSLAD